MTTSNERRRTIRVVVTSPIDVQSEEAARKLHLLDVSMGGFSASSSAAVALDVVMTFHFSASPGHWSAVLQAKGVYSRQHHVTPEGVAVYLSGFKFIDPESPSVQPRILALMDRATSTVTFS